MVFLYISIWGLGALFWGYKPTKAPTPRGDGTEQTVDKS